MRIRRRGSRRALRSQTGFGIAALGAWRIGWRMRWCSAIDLQSRYLWSAFGFTKSTKHLSRIHKCEAGIAWLFDSVMEHNASWPALDKEIARASNSSARSFLRVERESQMGRGKKRGEDLNLSKYPSARFETECGVRRGEDMGIIRTCHSASTLTTPTLPAHAGLQRRARMGRRRPKKEEIMRGKKGYITPLPSSPPAPTHRPVPQLPALPPPSLAFPAASKNPAAHAPRERGARPLFPAVPAASDHPAIRAGPEH